MIRRDCYKSTTSPLSGYSPPKRGRLSFKKEERIRIKNAL
jgi:hypothetical protein